MIYDSARNVKRFSQNAGVEAQKGRRIDECGASGNEARSLNSGTAARSSVTVR
jgi:anthranilate phosphoribosyltransferase